MSVVGNLAVSVVAGVAVMFIWQQIQKNQNRTTNQPILRPDDIGFNSGGVKGGQVFFGSSNQLTESPAVTGGSVGSANLTMNVDYMDGILEYITGSNRKRYFS